MVVVAFGPFDGWPSGGGGFEYFYGFIGGENNQWDPALYEGTTPIEPPATPEEGYHLTQDLADKAISWIHQQKALMGDRPFMVYFAPGGPPTPRIMIPRSGLTSTGASSTKGGTLSENRPSPARRNSGSSDPMPS